MSQDNKNTQGKTTYLEELEELEELAQGAFCASSVNSKSSKLDAKNKPVSDENKD
jgi:hypothetical protein